MSFLSARGRESPVCPTRLHQTICNLAPQYPLRRLDIELGVCTQSATPLTSLPYEPFDLNVPLHDASAMPSLGALALGGELGRAPRKRGGKTHGTPAMASNPRARAAFKFFASLAARTRINTRPHIQRRER